MAKMASPTGVVKSLPLRSLEKTTINADAFPQPFKQNGSPGRSAGDELDACALSLQLLGIFRADESAEAGDEALEGRHIQLVPPPEGVDDLGPGVAFSGCRTLWAN
jgi:hypothetical protein